MPVGQIAPDLQGAIEQVLCEEFWGPGADPQKTHQRARDEGVRVILVEDEDAASPTVAQIAETIIARATASGRLE